MEASDENDLLELADCTGEKDNLVATENRSNWKKKILNLWKKLATRFDAPGGDHGDQSPRGRRRGSGGG
jgi:hypothetical protein